MNCDTGIGSFEYTPIHIDWDTGHLVAVPPLFFDEATPKQMRMIIKMSVQSDSGYVFKAGQRIQTNSIWMWKQAINACRKRLPELDRAVDKRWDASIEFITDQLKGEFDAKKIRALKKQITEKERSRAWEHKRVSAYEKRLDRFEHLLIELTAKE